MEAPFLTSGELCPHCGQPMPAASAEPVVPAPEVAEEKVMVCVMCGGPVKPDQPCDNPECPKVAAQRIHEAGLNTPFKLGL